MLEPAEGCVLLFSSLNYPEVKADLTLFSQVNGRNYEVYDINSIASNKKLRAKPADFEKIINEEIRPYSTAKFGYHKGRGMMVGSLARLALQGNLLKGKAKGFFKAADIDFQNPYHNNLAQAIENYHFVQEANEILAELIENAIDPGATELPTKLGVGKNLVGVGALEAPRGSLYYKVSLDSQGLISSCNIITPTVQNLSSLEETAQAVLYQMKGQPKEKIQERLEMLVRAYDPCITCSVH